MRSNTNVRVLRASQRVGGSAVRVSSINTRQAFRSDRVVGAVNMRLRASVKSMSAVGARDILRVTNSRRLRNSSRPSIKPSQTVVVVLSRGSILYVAKIRDLSASTLR